VRRVALLASPIVRVLSGSVFRQNKAKQSKAAGRDWMPAEVLKADVNASVDMLEILLKRIWEEEEVPVEYMGLQIYHIW